MKIKPFIWCGFLGLLLLQSGCRNQRRDRPMSSPMGGGGSGSGVASRRPSPRSQSAGPSQEDPGFRSFDDLGGGGFAGTGPFPDTGDPSRLNSDGVHGVDQRGRPQPYGPLLPNSLRTPAPENDRGPGVTVGRVNPNPPKNSAISPQNWKVLVEENEKLKRKPKLPPVKASASPSEPPPAPALAAVKRCIACHESNSDRKLVLDADPARALAGLKELIGKPTGVSWMKVTEMIRSSRFAHLPQDEEQAFVAYLSGQAAGRNLEMLYNQVNRSVLQGVTEPPEKLPGSDNPLYRKLLRQIDTENPVLNAILNDPSLVIYDDGLRRKYQDGGSRDVVGDHHEDGLLLQSWKKEDGSPVFPNGRLYGPLGSGFGMTAGSQNFKFIWRPRENGQVVKDRLRVDPYRDGASSAPPGELMDTQHPVGTIVGEVVYENGVVKDLRLREVAPGLRTQSTAYRLFTEASEMEKSVNDLIEERPEWAGNLAPLRDHLASDRALTPGPALKDDYHTRVIDARGYQDVLPAVGREQQAALFRGKKFSSALGKEWKREGDRVSYAPTSRDPSALVSQSIDHHGVSLDSDSCMRCHEMAGTNFAFFAPRVSNTTTGAGNINNYGMLYGGVRNNIFSYHSRPFDNPNDFGRGGLFSGVFDTAIGREGLSDNRKNPDGTWKIRPGAPITDHVPANQEVYFQ